jgi:hypothetical protein
MKVISSIAGLALLSFGATAAQAQNFTFDAMANAPVTVGGPDYSGAPVVGVYWTGTTTTTWPDGKRTTEKYTCISTTQPRNDKIFDTHAVCDSSGPDGTFSSVWGCQFTSKDMQSMGCLGGLNGRTGRFAGMGGTITFMGRGGNGSGTGTWSKAAD